ncbi:hypothetical protein [Nocardiopsis alba]|uniref:hypothetical protein n=1 Tax=Nocardiopsis alba TaxID=53437 RepID=UPI000B21A12E|nr:hypothetical protein [Nocardiopsis alba]
MNPQLVRIEARLWDWPALHTLTGDASFVPDSMIELVSQASEDDAMNHYWDIENSVFVQGRLFEAAEATVSLAMAALACDPPSHVKPVLFEVIFQIVSGVAHEDVLERGDLDLEGRCKGIVERGAWILEWEALRKSGGQALDILERLGTDRARIDALRGLGR